MEYIGSEKSEIKPQITEIKSAINTISELVDRFKKVVECAPLDIITGRDSEIKEFLNIDFYLEISKGLFKWLEELEKIDFDILSDLEIEFFLDKIKKIKNTFEKRLPNLEQEVIYNGVTGENYNICYDEKGELISDEDKEDKFVINFTEMEGYKRVVIEVVEEIYSVDTPPYIYKQLNTIIEHIPNLQVDYNLYNIVGKKIQTSSGIEYIAYPRNFKVYFSEESNSVTPSAYRSGHMLVAEQYIAEKLSELDKQIIECIYKLEKQAHNTTLTQEIRNKAGKKLLELCKIRKDKLNERRLVLEEEHENEQIINAVATFFVKNNIDVGNLTYNFLKENEFDLNLNTMLLNKLTLVNDNSIKEKILKKIEELSREKS